MSSRGGLPWTPDRRQALVALLANDFTTPASIMAIMDDAGISRVLLPLDDTAGDRWRNLVNKLLIKQKLDALLEVAFAKSVTLERRLAEVDASLAPPPVGNPADAYEVRLLGGIAKKPLINRRQLRTNFKQFLDEQAPVLVIRGPARSGKSFSYELMRHVARSLGRDIFYFDFSSAANGNKAIDLIMMIARKLGIESKPPERNSTAEKYAAELVQWFVGVYRRLPTDRPRILVIDGLNRINLKPDVQSLALRLATEVIKGELGDTQLVLTGYDGSFDRDLIESLLIEEIVRINRTDVRLFFDGLECDRKPSPEELDDLVEEAMPGDAFDALDELSGRVRKLALKLIGSP